MEMTTIIDAFEKGGYTLVFVIALAWMGRTLYLKLTEQNEKLSKKVDELAEKVTELKTENTRWTTLISALEDCNNESCPNNKLIRKIKEQK